MAENIKVTITKLNNENYFIWKYKMELLLIKEGLWDTLNLVKPTLKTDGSNAGEISTWQTMDDKARALIGLLVEDSQLCLIRKETTAKATWDALKNYHEKGTLSNKVSLMRRICSLKMDEEGNMESHISELTNLFQRLTDLGEEQLSDSWTVAMLLSSLPRSYDTLVTALETRPEKDLTISLVQSKLISEYHRRKDTRGVEDGKFEDTILKTTQEQKGDINKFNLSCYFCNRRGHFKKDCIKYRQWKSKNEKVNKVEENPSNSDYLFSCETIRNGWVIDSGATSHICYNEKSFKKIDYKYKNSINVANGEKVNVEGKGTCEIEFVNEKGDISKALLTDVLFVPKIKGNLISVKKLTDKGFTINFKKSFCEIIWLDRQIAIADTMSNLFKLRQINKNEVNLINPLSDHKENCIHYWHRVFGHRDPKAIKEICSKGLVIGINLNECRIKSQCEVCLEAKMTRLPFPKESLSTSKEVLDLIHTDVCGPMQTKTSRGFRYIVTFIDDYSHYTVIYLLKLKSEVENKMKEYIEMVKTKFGKKPKIIRSDRGGEYTSNNILNYMKSEGIQLQLTSPYSPQQNGVAERKNRTLIEMARCMLLEANLPNVFWGEAVMTANYIQNRLTTKSVSTITPFERWNGQKPSIKYFKIFGTRCFVHIPSEKRKKLDNTAMEMIFIGYEENSKAYRCFSPDLKKVFISRDVRFIDDKMSIKNNVFSELIQTLKSTNNEINSDVEINIYEKEKDGNEEEKQIINKRISQRTTKGIPPPRLIEEINVTYDKIKEPKNLQEALESENKEQWIEAMKDEIKSLMKNKTWELCHLPPDRIPIGCKWVYKVKTDAEGKITRFKARLVAQGFSQKFGTDYDQVFAPVVRQTTFRILLSIASQEKYIVHHFDAKTAFLNGNLKEVIYMRQPPGFEENLENNLVCLLKKSLYGLKQAAKSWNDAIHDLLLSLNFQQSKADICFYKKKFNEEWCFLLIYVDDFVVVAKSKEIVNKVKEEISARYEIQDLGEIKYYLGIEVSRDSDGIFNVNQENYIRKLVKEFGLEKAKNSRVPMNMNYGKSDSTTEDNFLLSNKNYQKLIGCLLYISLNTRPDIAASVAILAQKTSQPKQLDWDELKRVLKYLKGTAHYKLALGKLNFTEEKFYGYADANWAEDKTDRKSNSGYVFFVNGAIVSWACRKQRCVALSSTEAEFISLSEACQEAFWIRQLLEDMQQTIESPTTIYEDNQSALKLIEDGKLSNRSKHIDIRHKYIRDYTERNLVICKYCPTESMLADMLTKPLPPTRHETLLQKCGLHD